MNPKPRAKYGCFVCNEYSEAQAGFCVVNMHEYGELQLNEKKTAYRYFFQQCFAHLNCIRPYIEAGKVEPDKCVVCEEKVESPDAAVKLAIYLYRKRGCYSVASIHNGCFRRLGAKSKAFVLRIPKQGG